MKKMVRKIFSALRPYTLDIYVYRYDLSRPIPEVKARIDLDVKRKEKNTFLGKKIIFSAFHNGALTNKADLVFNNLLGRQLGFKGYPIMGNAITTRQFRGNNIMAFTLVKIFDHYKNMREKDAVYIFTSFDNFSMQSVMDKVGCEKLCRVRVKRMLGFCVRKEIVND